MIVAGQIRAYLRTLLQDLPAVKRHIVIDRFEVPNDDDGHWTVIGCGDELIETVGLGTPALGVKQSHALDINFDITFPDLRGGFDKAEAILEAIIPVLANDVTLGGLVKWIRPLGVRRDRNTEGAPVARVRLQCQTQYQTYNRDPSTSV